MRNVLAQITLPYSTFGVARSSRRGTSLVLAWVGIAAVVGLPGCVRRRLLVRSNPPGATVYVDNQPVGVTPCATSFVYYGTREIRLVKAGYETLTVNQPIPAPWYEIPPLDFVSENLTPREIQDYRTVSFNLIPQIVVPTEQLLARAEELRVGTWQGSGISVPGGASQPPEMLNQALPFPPGAMAPPSNGVTVNPGWVNPLQGAPPANAYGPPRFPSAPAEPLRPGPLSSPSSQETLPPGGMRLEAVQ